MSLTEFFNAYLNPIKILESKREWKEQISRVKTMPEDYQYVFEKIQRYMFMHSGGDGMDMVKIQYDLVELFEEGVNDGRDVLDMIGEDVATFCDELLRNSGAKLWTERWPQELNQDIANKLKKGKKG